jgi:hypothetical protein
MSKLGNRVSKTRREWEIINLPGFIMKCSVLERASEVGYFLARSWLLACSNKLAGARFWLLRIIQLVADLVTFTSSLWLLLLLGSKPYKCSSRQSVKIHTGLKPEAMWIEPICEFWDKGTGYFIHPLLFFSYVTGVRYIRSNTMVWSWWLPNSLKMRGGSPL